MQWGKTPIILVNLILNTNSLIYRTLVLWMFRLYRQNKAINIEHNNGYYEYGQNDRDYRFVFDKGKIHNCQIWSIKVDNYEGIYNGEKPPLFLLMLFQE